jgi:transcriptional regulator with XRE-family HTH domain
MKYAHDHVPEVLRTFLRLLNMSQEQLGGAFGLTQTQVSRRLSGRGDISQDELRGLAAFFGVEMDTFYKPLAEAVADLMASAKLDELRSGSSAQLVAA